MANMVEVASRAARKLADDLDEKKNAIERLHHFFC